MSLRALFFATLTALLASGCLMGHWDCDAGQADFTLDEPVDAQALEALAERLGLESVDELACEDVCADAQERASGWLVVEVTSCELDLAAGDTGDTAAADGALRCDGAEVEYMCE